MSTENREKVNETAHRTIRKNAADAVTKAIETVRGDMDKRGFETEGVKTAVKQGVEDAYRNIK